MKWQPAALGLIGVQTMGFVGTGAAKLKVNLSYKTTAGAEAVTPIL